jgi:hypothetical protein
MTQLILCDGGGNRSHHFIFKEDLHKTANALGLEIRIAHYPPYNPIEHRFFPHVTRACEGVVFDSVETVKILISRTTTSKGLTIIVNILDKIYETGRKYAHDFKERMPIVFDKHLLKWNYRAIPQKKLISGSYFVHVPQHKLSVIFTVKRSTGLLWKK